MNYKTIVLALLLAAGSLHAQTPAARDRVRVQPAWLAEHLQDRDLVLLHVGPRPEYDAGHIPGARYLNYQDLAVTDDELPRPRSVELHAVERRGSDDGPESGRTVAV